MVEVSNHQENFVKRLVSKHGKHIKTKSFVFKSLQVKGKLNEIVSGESNITASRNSIMGLEGSVSNNYWQLISAHLPDEFQFNSRSRRPAKDAFNATINYLYGMMYTTVEQAVFATGMDPHIGFLHTEGYKRISLVFDLIEPFRSFADELVVELFKTRKIDASFFTKKEKGMWLNAKGKKVIIPAFNTLLSKKLLLFDMKGTLKNQIYRFCETISKKLKESDL